MHVVVLGAAGDMGRTAVRQRYRIALKQFDRSNLADGLLGGTPTGSTPMPRSTRLDDGVSCVYDTHQHRYR